MPLLVWAGEYISVTSLQAYGLDHAQLVKVARQGCLCQFETLLFKHTEQLFLGTYLLRRQDEAYGIET
jgi:hypothetical protein